MNILPTAIAGLWLIETQPRGDERGTLTRLHCDEALSAIRPGLHFCQSNLTVTATKGTVRGMHFQQTPALEAKLVRCLNGAVHDVVVDLRAGSPTFLQSLAFELTGVNHQQLFIPEGCAHGFQALSDGVQMLYQHTAAYAPAHERGLRHDDPRLAIAWPLPASVISARDAAHPLLDESFQGLPV